MARRGNGDGIFFNRELSWLEFNQRVLDEALDPRVPLLDRLNFLGITASNLDEFFMVRVGGLEMLARQGVRKRDPSGRTPGRQLRAVAARTRRMVESQYECWRTQIEPALSEAGIRRLSARDLSAEQDSYVRGFFSEEVFPVVSPAGVHAGEEFPNLANLWLYAAVRLRSADSPRGFRLVILPIRPTMNRFVALPDREGYSFITIEDVIALCAESFFPGQEVQETASFRITRNADIGVREDQAADFMAQMEEVLAERKWSDCVRLEIASDASPALRRMLVEALAVPERNVYAIPGPLDLAGFRRLAGLDDFEHLRYPQWTPQPSPLLDLQSSIFEQLRKRDVLLSHPYESFDPVVRLVEEASRDPAVLAIKQILYRTSARSPVVAALREAAERGKYVTALVELKARFDEARNIEWAKELEDAGVQVVYGVKGLKTHAKVCIVVRREPQGIVRYVHFGTGNYNENTARLYADLGFMTRHPDYGADASAFFNAVTGHSEPGAFLKICASPLGLREKLLEMIESEAARSRQGQPALIRLKANSLTCPRVISALYRASQAGVRVQLNVRGVCCLRPGVEGLSENISVVSIVDRFLEHSRVYHFRQGGEDRVFISSADLMPRNLDRRVELLVPIEDAASRRRLLSMLDAYFRDTEKARWLLADGSYVRQRAPGRRAFRCQTAMCRAAEQATRTARAARRSTLEPILPAEAPRP